ILRSRTSRSTPNSMRRATGGLLLPSTTTGAATATEFRYSFRSTLLGDTSGVARRIRRVLFWLVGVPLGIAVVAVGAFVGYVLYLSWQTPSIDKLQARPETSNSIVYAAD